MPIIASLPILVILVLMIGFRWGAARAGAAGYLVAFFVAVAFFGAGADVLAFAHTKALILTVDVLLIIWAALPAVPRGGGSRRHQNNRQAPALANSRSRYAGTFDWLGICLLPARRRRVWRSGCGDSAIVDRIRLHATQRRHYPLYRTRLGCDFRFAGFVIQCAPVRYRAGRSALAPQSALFSDWHVC